MCKKWGNQISWRGIKSVLKSSSFPSRKRAWQSCQNAEKSLREIWVRTDNKTMVYDEKKSQIACGAKVSDILPTPNGKVIDVESREERKENELLNTNTMEELINHAWSDTRSPWNAYTVTKRSKEEKRKPLESQQKLYEKCQRWKIRGRITLILYMQLGRRWKHQ